MDSDSDDPPKRAGFPHSDTPGSKLVCQLPEAYRRLPRPSSPVAAKASTECAYSLDHTTPSSLLEFVGLNAISPILSRTLRSARRFTTTELLRSTKSARNRPASAMLGPLGTRGSEHPQWTSGGASRSRTGDLLLAKQVLSQLSYGPANWWVWVDLNYRPHPYQGCALTN